MPRLPNYKRSAILFVDDEEKSLKYFSKIFSNDFRIITCINPSDAIKVLEQQSSEIAVLITDQRMPKQTGVDLLKHTRYKYPQIIRLLTTAYTDINDAIEAVNTGEIFRYITKPWDIESLSDHLMNAMNLYLAREQERNLLVEKRQAMHQFAGNIAHELRTPLTSIYAAAKGTSNYLPQLIDVYEKACQNDSSIQPIRDIHLETLKDSLSNISDEAQHSLTIIDILLMNIKRVQIEPESMESLSIRECIDESLSRYPFRNDKERVIDIIGNDDFEFRGVRLLIVHVFFNLIKNALYALNKDGNRGAINIRIKSDTEKNKVYFKDTGPGIRATVLPYIFDPFYSTKSPDEAGSIGIGLPFCKNVLSCFGADIECFSEEGIYTEFILSFPHISD